jgi:hypothetical protein
MQWTMPHTAKTFQHVTLICLASQESVIGKQKWITQRYQDCSDSINTTMSIVCLPQCPKQPPLLGPIQGGRISTSLTGSIHMQLKFTI